MCYVTHSGWCVCFVEIFARTKYVCDVREASVICCGMCLFWTRPAIAIIKSRVARQQCRHHKCDNPFTTPATPRLFTPSVCACYISNTISRLNRIDNYRIESANQCVYASCGRLVSHMASQFVQNRHINIILGAEYMEIHVGQLCIGRGAPHPTKYSQNSYPHLVCIYL